MTTTQPQPKRNRFSRPSAARPLKLWQEHSQNQEARIEIVPLIDVIFCILTFFILAAVGFSRQQAINLDLPKAKTGTGQMREMLIVSLNEFGQVFVEQQPVSTRKQLAEAVESYFLTRPDGLMVLYASKNAVYNEVIQVLDVLREVGGNRVTLGTIPEGSQPSPGPSPFPTNLPTPGLTPTPLNPNLTPSSPNNSPATPNGGADNLGPTVPRSSQNEGTNIPNQTNTPNESSSPNSNVPGDRNIPPLNQGEPTRNQTGDSSPNVPSNSTTPGPEQE